MIFGRLKAWLIAAGAALVAALGLFLAGKREGRRDGRRQAQEDDYENAADIRDRVSRNLDQRVREMDGRGYRD